MDHQAHNLKVAGSKKSAPATKDGAGRLALPRQRALRALQNDDLHRRPAAVGHDPPWVLDGPMAMPSEPTSSISSRRPSGVAMSWCSTNSAHKVAGIREAITDRHAQIFYLPPYSLDLDPIEMAFSKLKALLRQEPARTIDGLVERIGTLLDRYLPTEYANFFHAAGYQRPT